MSSFLRLPSWKRTLFLASVLVVITVLVRLNRMAIQKTLRRYQFTSVLVRQSFDATQSNRPKQNTTQRPASDGSERNKHKNFTISSQTGTPPRTTPKPSGLDSLDRAAAAMRSSYVSHSYKFAEDPYFHRPKSDRGGWDLPALLINPADVCSKDKGGGGADGSREPFMAVLVMSSYMATSSEERRAIRQTYGSAARGGQWPGAKRLAAPLRLLFLLGAPPSQADRDRVQAESAEHGDLVVADFVDSYRNLTIKVLVGLDWVLRHCPPVKFILKTDEDTFVHLPLLTAFLLQRGRNNSVYGHGYFTGKSVVQRKGRWGVPVDVFPFRNYPNYMSGTGYVLARDAAEKIADAAKRQPLLPIEDAFVTGILTMVTGVRQMFSSGFTHFHEGRPKECDFVLDTRFVGNGVHAKKKISLWTKLKIDDRRLCG